MGILLFLLRKNLQRPWAIFPSQQILTWAFGRILEYVITSKEFDKKIKKNWVENIWCMKAISPSTSNCFFRMSKQDFQTENQLEKGFKNSVCIILQLGAEGELDALVSLWRLGRCHSLTASYLPHPSRWNWNSWLLFAFQRSENSDSNAKEDSK